MSKQNGRKQRKPDGRKMPSVSRDRGSDGKVFPDVFGREKTERQAVNWAVQRLKDFPDVRLEKIGAAKRRIAEGFYERPEVVEKIAERILEEMGVWP